jgi:hypothetical protein
LYSEEHARELSLLTALRDISDFNSCTESVVSEISKILDGGVMAFLQFLFFKFDHSLSQKKPPENAL